MKEIVMPIKLCGGTVDIVFFDVSVQIAQDIVDLMYPEALRLQSIFNLYDPKSELSQLNLMRSMKVSSELMGVVTRALVMCELTVGSYDISLGTYFLLRKQGISSVPQCSYRDIVIEGDVITLTNENAILDLGSIAKGYIADRLADMMRIYGVEHFIIDARGDMFVFGDASQVLGVQHPRSDGSICDITLKNQAVATSGDYTQYVGSFEKSHILNQKDVISVTVVASTVEEADVLATVFMVSTMDQIKQICILYPRVKVLLINRSNDLLMLNGFDELVVKD